MLLRSLLFVLVSLGALGLLAQGTASIRIEVKLNKPAAGEVRLALCPDSASFEDEVNCRFEKLKATGSVVVFDVSGLAPGDYAIRAVHDLDADGDIDVNTLGIPTEPFGFSNDAMGKMGPPGFEQAKFTLKPGSNSVSFRMRGG